MFEGRVPLQSLSPGETFLIDDKEFIVLEHTYRGTYVLSENFIYIKEKFGTSSDWRTAILRWKLENNYFQSLLGVGINVDDIISFPRDLSSQDGLDDYNWDSCWDKVSLLTTAEYAKYHKILGVRSKYPNWWWTITPATTPSNGIDNLVCVVDTCGMLSWSSCIGSDSISRGGVRPLLCLRSSMLVLPFKKCVALE